MFDIGNLAGDQVVAGSSVVDWFGRSFEVVVEEEEEGW